MDALRAIKPRLLNLFALVLAFSLPLPATAQEADDVQLPGQSDVRIVVDISGSMKDTDPTNLRQPAVRLLARLLPEGATAGVWTFGQYVNMLVPHREVNDQWRDMAIERSEQINSVALRTNLGKAIEVASDGYYTDGDLSRTHFILLTDGKVDISADSAFHCQSITGQFTTLTGAAADGGANGLTMQWFDDGRDLRLFNDFIPCSLVFSPGRQRSSGVAGDPSNQLFFPIEFDYLFKPTSAFRIEVRSTLAFANDFQICLHGTKYLANPGE